MALPERAGRRVAENIWVQIVKAGGSPVSRLEQASFT
jgi:hypothetical protein